MAMLRLKNVSKSFSDGKGGLEVLEGVSFASKETPSSTSNPPLPSLNDFETFFSLSIAITVHCIFCPRTLYCRPRLRQTLRQAGPARPSCHMPFQRFPCSC